MPQEEHPALIEARERLEQLRREQEERELAAQEQPEETPDIPAPEEEQEHPALVEARAKLEAARAGEEYRPPVEQNEGALGDAWTAAKIGGRIATQGPAIRAETERGLREITRDQVAEQLADEDIAGIEQLSGKKISEMNWNEFDRAAYKFYGEEPREDYSEDEPWLKRKLLGETQSVWGRKLREMSGFYDPEGQEAFPMAKDMISGSMATATSNTFPLTAGFLPNPQGIYESVVRPIIYEDGVEAKEAADAMAQSIADLKDEYSEAAQKQDELPFIRDEATWNPLTWFGRGESKNIRGIFNATIEQAPMIGGMIVASRAGGRGGAAYASRKFGRPTDTIERMQAIQRRGARAGGAIAGGATEGVLIRDAVFHETQSRLMHDTPQEQWEANEDYQRLMESGQLTSEEAKQMITYGYANKAGDMAMVISGALMGTPMGYFYGSLTGVSGGRQAAKESILRQMTKGALTEMGQEMAQESFEQIASNLQVMNIDTNVNWYDGVANAMVGAAFISGPYGALGGIRSDRGAGVAKEKDQLARTLQGWANAGNAKYKYATEHGEGSKFAESASPQDQLKAMIEQERLQEKEASEWLKISGKARELMEKIGAKPQQLADFDAKTEAYKTDLAFIAKRKKARLNARKQQREEEQATREREAARKQVERDVNQINDNLRMVSNMQAVQKGESLENEQQYEELRRAGYGTWTADDKKFVLTERGIRAMQDMAVETVDIRNRVERAATGKYGGPERRTQRVLRESFEGLSDEEFEAQVLKDPQTQLWNKRKLDEDIRENPPNAVAFIDADALKWVNDNMSYSAGDEYLRAITREIESLGRGFKAYRRGGDEFVVTGPNMDMVESAIEKAKRRVMQAPRVEEAGKSVAVEMSIGYGADLESAEASLKNEKQRRIESGERVDTRIEGATPPSLRTVTPADSPQMSLFALAANSKWFNDDMFGHPDNPYSESDWDEYIWAQNAAHWRKKKELKQVDPQHFSWIEEVVTEFLPNDNSNNPPITIVHDAEWLRKLSPNQYKELMDLPFGATGVRGLFSLDDPSHGVFLMADVIINEAKSKLKRGMRIDSWGSVKWNIKEGMEIEVIDAKGKVHMGRVTAFTKKSLYGGVSKRSASERRLTTEAIQIRQKLNRLAIKEINLLKEHSKMGAEKRRNKNHPITKALSRTLDEVGALESDLRVLQDALQLERSKAWLEAQQGAEDETNSVTVELRDGTTIRFDPEINEVTKLLSGDANTEEMHLGRLKAPKASTWRFNLGNEAAAQDEPLTKQVVQEVAADTVMHETVGHYGVRGITKEWDTYLELTHALVDAFPEVAESLRLMGYNYRDDLKRGEHLNAQNKALLGEEIMAWTAGRILGADGMQGMNATQQSVVQRFMSWFKEQLLKLGFNRLYRNAKAAEIRRARRQMYTAKNNEKFMEAHRKLYGWTDADGKFNDGLVYIGRSGVRTGSNMWGYKSPKSNKGVVVRSSKGFLNDQDLLYIIQRSLDFIRNGRQKWKFTDHAGARHWLPMRDMEIFRKPVEYVLMNGTRPRAEEEMITAEDREPAPPVPTIDEAYRQLFDKDMPDGFKIVTPADFKDEAKRIEAEMMQGKSDEEIKQMRKDRVFPNPKQLYDQAVQDMSPEMLEQAKQVQSVITQAEKEVERREKGLRSKEAKLDLLYKKWGRDVVDNDEIPIFPETGSLNDFLVAINNALPSAKTEGYLSKMEIDASGVMDALWPSRLKMYFDNAMLDEDVLISKTSFTKKRIEQLKEPAAQMNENEAKELVDFIEGKLPGTQPNQSIPDRHLNIKQLQQNAAITPQHFVDYVADWAQGSHDPGLTALIGILGENHESVQEYLNAMADVRHPNPQRQQQGRSVMDEIMNTPIDAVNQNQIPKDWLAKRIEKPKYSVHVTAPIQVPRSWEEYYKEEVGNRPEDDNIYDIYDVPEPLQSEIRVMQRQDEQDGPDIGKNPVTGEWYIMPPANRTANEWPGLMVDWIVPDSYNGTVFWQFPTNNVSTHHFGFAEFVKRGHAGPMGIWGHTRWAETYDGADIIPTAPNADKQGRALFLFEFQSDAFQKAAKMYNSQEEQDQAMVQRKLDGLALSSAFRSYVTNFADSLMSPVLSDLQNEMQNIDDATLYQYAGTEENWNNLNRNEQKWLREVIAASRLVGSGYAALTGLRTKINNVQSRALAAEKPLKRAASGNQPRQSITDYEQGRLTSGAADVTIIGDARMFEWMDHRAAAIFMAQMADFPANINRVLEDMANARPGSDSWKRMAKTGGPIGFLKKYQGDDAAPQYQRLANSLNNMVDNYAMRDENNQAGHRLAYMKPIMNDYMTQMLEEMNYPLPRGVQSHAEMAEKMMDDALDQSKMTVRIEAQAWADILGERRSKINSIIRDFRDNHPMFKKKNVRYSRDGEQEVIEIIGQQATLEAMKQDFEDNLKRYFATKLNEGTLSDTRYELERREDEMKRKWHEWGTDSPKGWKQDFQLNMAKIKITDDPNEPMVHVEPRMADGTINDALDLMRDNGVETFEQYVKRKWERRWQNATPEDRASFQDDGGSETEPTPNFYESYATAWNDSRPYLLVGKLPVKWNQQSQPEEWVDFRIIKAKVGGDEYRFEVDGQLKFTLESWDLRNAFASYVKTWYEDNNIAISAYKLPSLRTRYLELKREIKDYQDQLAKGEEKEAKRTKELFDHESLLPTIQEGKIEELDKAFLRVISSHKKSGYFKQELMQKNEQWRIAQMLWGISEAVRRGYSRIHLGYGSATGARGGFGGDADDSNSLWHHVPSISYKLTQQELRGEMRDILMIETPHLKNGMWIDVTDDKMLPLHPRDQVDNDPLDGYFSNAVAAQLGRDVARVIGEKIAMSNNAVKADRLLISQAGEDTFILHDTQGNVVSTHPSRRAAQNARRSKEEADDVTPSIVGSVNQFDVGGPIMFMKSHYSGGSRYNFNDAHRYQHTFQPPTMAGGIRNYDLTLISRFNAYLKRFGLEVEEGWAKVDQHEMRDTVFAEGSRQEVEFPSSFADKYPNIRVDEVTGENYGWIVNSDKGMVVPTVYKNPQDADEALQGVIAQHAVMKDGRVKVYSITINDKLRKHHEKPINPYVSVLRQTQSNKHLEALLDKIGSKKPSLLDRFNKWKRAWAARANIAVFDRFYGILHSLKMTGMSDEAYMKTRLSTGLESIMRSVMEYGWPVWMDGVVETQGKGLLAILEPVADVIEHWGGYQASKRAKGLLMEGYDNLDSNQRALLARASRHFVGADEREKVWNLLVYVAEKNFEEEDATRVTRRDVLKGILSAGATIQMGMPNLSNAAERDAYEIVREFLDRGGKMISPKRLKNPEQGRYSMRKLIMEKTGADEKIADEMLDKSINRALKDFRAARKFDEVIDQEFESAASRDKQEFALNDINSVRGTLDDLIDKGREHYFSPAQIEAGIRQVDDFPIFESVSKDYAHWNKKMLDFAEEAGVINPDTRVVWENSDYIPFYRISEDERVQGAFNQNMGIANQNSPIATLTGGQSQMGDVIHNIFINATKLMDASLKNNAALAVIDSLEPTGIIRKEGKDTGRALIKNSELRDILESHGMNVDDMAPEVFEGVRMMFTLEAPSGPGIISVMRNGKHEYYKTEDELLYRSMTALNMERFKDFLGLMRGPKRLLTTAVTLDPGFMIANFIRDTMSGWVLSRDNFIPMWGGLKGFKEAITEGDSFKAMMASGAAFDSGFINQGDPRSTHRYIKNAMKDAGFQRTVLNTPRKLWNAYKRLGSATENANRIAVYDAAIRAGKSKLQAAYESKDLMDFSMSGDHRVIQFLIQTVPFMGARLQGLHRLGRGAREHPVNFLIKGTLLTMAGMALWFKFRDDPRYERLEEWDKDAYFHFWIGDQHFRLPKGFEVGAIFNTIPERMFEYMWSEENDAGRHLMKRFGYMLAETFNMDPIPQTIKPLVEGYMNKNRFTGRAIENPWEEQMLPRDRYRYYTSSTMRGLSNILPEMPTVANGSITSPLQLQNVYAGYTGTLGRYALMATDMFMREFLDHPVPPEMELSNYPVLGRFYRGEDKAYPEGWAEMSPEEQLLQGLDFQSTKRTKYEEKFYEELRLVGMAMNSERQAERGMSEADERRLAEIEERFGPQLDVGQEYENVRRAVGRLNREIRDVYTDPDMDRAEKRRLINQLQQEKNDEFEAIYQVRPSAADEADTNIDTLIDSYDPSVPEPPSELADKAPQTAELVAGVAGMSSQQLQRLARAANYRGEA